MKKKKCDLVILANLLKEAKKGKCHEKLVIRLEQNHQRELKRKIKILLETGPKYSHF